MLGWLSGKDIKFYGSVTVGERGQVIIPAEARRDLDITNNSKLLVFTGPNKNGLMFIKADSIKELISNIMGGTANVEQILESDSTESHDENR
jgi:AbrB family looped-hinge helix DNA binding protein